MLSLGSDIDIPSSVWYTTPDLGWKEPIYAVLRIVHHAMSGWGGETQVYGLTKSKDHAEKVAKEVDGWVEQTGWLDGP